MTRCGVLVFALTSACVGTVVAPHDAGVDAGPRDSGTPVVSRPGNILINGGFEYGLQCYGGWVWSAGTDPTAYDFFLSSDAFDGGYSLEIACDGGACGNGGTTVKAAIYTGDIPVPAGGADYAFSVETRCASGGSGFIWIPGTAGGDTTQPLVCSGSWTSNRATFSLPPRDAGYFSIHVYNNNAAPLFVDEAVLTYADGGVPPQTVVHPSARDVSISGRNVVVDGQPFLALGFFGVPFESLGDIADAGANLVTDIPFSGNCFNTEREGYLDKAYELGISVVPDSTFSARLQTPLPFAAILERFSQHSAIIAWNLVDEPELTAPALPWYFISAPTLTAEYQAAKTAAKVPIFADFQHAAWDSSPFDAPYKDAVDFWMAEPYSDDISGITQAVTTFDSVAVRPIWLAQDGNHTSSMILMKAYDAIIQGATGIVFFNWTAFSSNPPSLAAAYQVFGELGSLQSAIFGTELSSPVQATPGLKFVVRQAGGSTYVLAVNDSTNVSNGTFTVPGLPNGQAITVLFENRTIIAGGDQFTDTFSAISRHVYRWP